jgi:chemotaxis protein histidine kinase CheA
VGEGTGLGLSAVHGIVKDHGGEIRVESIPNEGAIFSIFLPEAGVSVLQTTPSTTLEYRPDERVLAFPSNSTEWEQLNQSNGGQ